MTTPTIRAIARTVGCPTCGALPGVRCTGANGHRARDPHRVRIRTASQKEES